jgi:hypothetical protein
MSRIDTAQIMGIVDKALETKEELLARGESPSDVLVVVGCALGVMLSGGPR